jgi:hypothetical protein
MKALRVLDQLNESGVRTPSAIAPFLLAQAVLCVDCEAIYCLPAQRCPLCASSVFFPLARWLSTKDSGGSAPIEGLAPPSRFMNVPGGLPTAGRDA